LGQQTASIATDPSRSQEQAEAAFFLDGQKIFIAFSILLSPYCFLPPLDGKSDRARASSYRCTKNRCTKKCKNRCIKK
jgi:hypothetical protein